MNNINIFSEKITNEKKLIDYFYSLTIFVASLSFFVVGISSYFKFVPSSSIVFFPQGITMCLYGTIGLISSIFQILTLYWEVGEGYNEFNKEKGTAKIVRKGYPGKNSQIELIYKLKDILRIF